MRIKIIKHLLSFVVSMTLTTTPAFAQSEDCPQGAAEFCYCIYEQALDDLMQMRGNTQATIAQKVSATKQALKSCLKRGEDQSIGVIKPK